ncbi:MAG: site-specific integrase [Treponema sp.]|jgi:integrase|nr:site-specific integrase [Treponema sp.]
MPRPKKPYVIQKRKGSKTYLLTLNDTSGLSVRICKEWQRKSFQNFPPELIAYSNPKTKAAAETSAMVLIAFLKSAGTSVQKRDFLVGDWLRLFTSLADSPKGARNIAENNSYSEQSIDRLKGIYEVHMKDDPFMKLLMSEIETSDALAFINRMGLRKLTGGPYRNKKDPPQMMGTETFAKLIKFVRMAFKEYGRERPYWRNAFQYIEPPKNIPYRERDAMPEDEVLRLFEPGVLLDSMEIAVCAAMFWAGLRRSEVFALRPEDLDWHTPKITVRKAWKNFTYKRRKLGTTKSKRERIIPFDEFLQNAIKKLWEENGQHEFVFSFADGTTPGPSWIKCRFKKWLARAGIELNGRHLVPHSSRHSLASILEERNVPLRHIQELLGHSSLKTTKRYLHSTDKTLRDIRNKTNEAREKPEPEVKIIQFAG